MNSQCESLAQQMDDAAHEVLVLAQYPHERTWVEGLRIAASLTRLSSSLTEARQKVYAQWQRTMPVASEMRAGIRAGLTMLDKEHGEESKQ